MNGIYGKELQIPEIPVSCENDMQPLVYCFL